MDISSEIKGDWLSLIEAKTIKSLIFLDEGTQSTNRFSGETQTSFNIRTDDGNEYKLSPNKPSKKNLAAKWGTDTAQWVGRKAEVTIQSFEDQVTNEVKEFIVLQPTMDNPVKIEPKQEEEIPVIGDDRKEGIDISQVPF